MHNISQILGNGNTYQGVCSTPLIGDDANAFVAVSTKYLTSAQGGSASDSGACGRCMCVRIHGADTSYNPAANQDNVRKYMGLTFAAQVGDRWERLLRKRCRRAHACSYAAAWLGQVSMGRGRFLSSWQIGLNWAQAGLGIISPVYTCHMCTQCGLQLCFSPADSRYILALS